MSLELGPVEVSAELGGKRKIQIALRESATCRVCGQTVYRVGGRDDAVWLHKERITREKATDHEAKPGEYVGETSSVPGVDKVKQCAWRYCRQPVYGTSPNSRYCQAHAQESARRGKAKASKMWRRRQRQSVG